MFFFGTLNLEADGDTLFLGTKLVAALDVQNATMITNNQVLAFAVLARSPHTYPRHWLLHLIIAEAPDITQAGSYSLIKIRREANKAVDTLSKKVRRTSIMNSCIFLLSGTSSLSNL